LALNLPIDKAELKRNRVNNMRHFHSIAVAAFAGCVGLALLPTLGADTWDKKTNLTVNEPLQVPSCCAPGHTVTLQPGEYVMVLVDSLSDRHIVRIYDKDQKNVMTTILAIPNYRLQPTGKTVFQYWEIPAGQPRALRAWFYPGDNFGQEFAYPKQTAAQIAALVKTPVPAIAVETSVAEDLKTAPLVAVDETGKTTDLVAILPERTADPALTPTVQAAPVEPTVQATVQPQITEMQAADRTPTADAERTAPAQTLPHTASILPLLGLVGLVSLGLYAALGFSTRRRRLCRV
jgi:hypothetical protein